MAEANNGNAIPERAYGKAPTSAPIVIDLPEIETAQDVSKAVAVVIQTAAEGKISPAEASTLCGILETQRRAIEASDLEARISAQALAGSSRLMRLVQRCEIAR